MLAYGYPSMWFIILKFCQLLYSLCAQSTIGMCTCTLPACSTSFGRNAIESVYINQILEKPFWYIILRRLASPQANMIEGCGSNSQVHMYSDLRVWNRSSPFYFVFQKADWRGYAGSGCSFSLSLFCCS